MKPFVKRGKTDAADTEALSEAVTCKAIRFMPVKSVDQQAAAMVLKPRELLVRQWTQAINALRGHLSEFGIFAAAGTSKVTALIETVHTDTRLPQATRFASSEFTVQIEALKKNTNKLERVIIAEAKRDEDMRRLTTIPRVGAIIAAPIKTLVPDPLGFKSGRYLAAWLDLTPRSYSSGGKERFGGTSKKDNLTLRSKSILGATAVVGHARHLN